MNAITAINPASNTVALPSIVGGGYAALPKAIKVAIVSLDLAFPAALTNLSEGDVGLRYEVYAEAVSGFPVAVAYSCC